MKIGPTSASFKSSGKHPFSNDKLMIFVISERCISSVTLSMSAGMSPTSVALKPSIFNGQGKGNIKKVVTKREMEMILL